MITLKNDFAKAAEIISITSEWRKSKGYPSGKTWSAEETTKDALLKRYIKNDFYVIDLDGTVIGAVILTSRKTHPAWQDDSRYSYIAKLCILEAYQKQGYADEVLKLAKETCTAIRLEIKDKGQHGLALLYERNGFKQTGIKNDMRFYAWELDNRTIGIEIELTGITRQTAAQIVAGSLGTDRIACYAGDFSITDKANRTWNIKPDVSLVYEEECGELIKNNDADESYSVEIISPILTAGDTDYYNAMLPALSKNGAVATDVCGMHVHISGKEHTAETLRELVFVMHRHRAELERALAIRSARREYCKFPREEIVNALRALSDVTMQSVEDVWYSGYANRTNPKHIVRRQFLNLHSFFYGLGTIEFRGFNTVFDCTLFNKYVELALAIDMSARTGDDLYAHSAIRNIGNSKRLVFAR